MLFSCLNHCGIMEIALEIVIVEDGKVGFALTQQLAREDHDIVVIDSNKMVLKESQQMVDIQVVHGNGASPVVQSAASVGESDLMIAATSADEINLLCCIVAKKLGCSHTIARVRNPEYYGQFFLLKDELGLNLMINPERATASEIFRLLQFPSFLKRDAFAKGRVEIVEVVLRPESHIVGKLLSELYHTVKVKVLVCAVERGNDVVIPDGSFRLQAGDKLYVTASSGDLARLIRSLHLNQKKIKNVMIIGGSRIAVYLAMALLDEGVDVKLIEIQKERCRQLAELLPKATVIFADGSDRSILDSEGIDQTDAVVTLTDIDEENLIVSMYANYLKVPKVITRSTGRNIPRFFGIRELIVWSALRSCVPTISSVMSGLWATGPAEPLLRCTGLWTKKRRRWNSGRRKASGAWAKSFLILS